MEEALELHQERRAVFEELGDKRERAVTLGDIARIYVSKGEVEEALELHREQLKLFNELGDLVGKANALWSLAQIDLSRENFRAALERLTESYFIFQKLGRLDGICQVGLDLGLLLCRAGQGEDGLKILNISHEGLVHLGQGEKAKQVKFLVDHFTPEKNPNQP